MWGGENNCKFKRARAPTVWLNIKKESIQTADKISKTMFYPIYFNMFTFYILNKQRLLTQNKSTGIKKRKERRSVCVHVARSCASDCVPESLCLSENYITCDTWRVIKTQTFQRFSQGYEFYTSYVSFTWKRANSSLNKYHK